MAVITLKSNDGQFFKVEAAVACLLSTKIKEMVDKRGVEDDDAKKLIELPVKGATLEKILEWMEQHKDDTPPQSPLDDYVMNDWDINFLGNFENKNDALFALVNAAHDLGINGLICLTCQAVSDLLKGKSSNEIRNLFSHTA